MVEEKKGHAKITIEIEINEALMDIVKESIAKMPEIARMGRRQREEK